VVVCGGSEGSTEFGAFKGKLLFSLPFNLIGRESASKIVWGGATHLPQGIPHFVDIQM
jgi:hypothetical protein